MPIIEQKYATIPCCGCLDYLRNSFFEQKLFRGKPAFSVMRTYEFLKNYRAFCEATQKFP